MAKGMSATNLIVALAVGLIIIVGLGYLVWTWLGRGGGTVTEQYCNSRKMAYCTQWAVSNYNPDNKPSDGWSEYAKDCTRLIPSVGQPDCEALLTP